MSFSDAVGQVDQILQWQQQVADPATLTAASPTPGSETAASGEAASSTSDSAFADALAQAQLSTESAAGDAIGTDSSADSDGIGLGSSDDLLGGGDSQLLQLLQSMSGDQELGDSATSAADPRIQAMVQEANSLVGKPYVWGGGHDGWGPQRGYDCSGFVSAVLHAGGYLSSPQDTATLPSAPGIESGPGQYVTIYDRDEAGTQGHVIIEIAGQFYESGGQAGSWGGGGGVERIATPSAAYLASFNDVLHPAGL